MSDYLRQDSDYTNYMTLGVAVHENKLNEVTKLLQLMNWHAYRHDPNNILHMATNNDSLDVIKVLLKHGINANCEKLTGDIPLHVACERINTDIVEILLNHGSGVNFKNKQGITPLKKLILTVYFSEDPASFPLERLWNVAHIIFLLLDHGAKLSNQDYFRLCNIFRHHKVFVSVLRFIYNVRCIRKKDPYSCIPENQDRINDDLRSIRHCTDLTRDEPGFELSLNNFAHYGQSRCLALYLYNDYYIDLIYDELNEPLSGALFNSFRTSRVIKLLFEWKCNINGSISKFLHRVLQGEDLLLSEIEPNKRIVFFEQIIKRVAANLYASSMIPIQDLLQLADKFGMNSSAYYFDRHKEEVRVLKDYNFSDGLTYYDFMRLHPNYLVKYFNDNTVEFFESQHFKCVFPLYADYLTVSYKRVSRRKVAVDLVKPQILQIFKEIDLPKTIQEEIPDVVDMVLCYLSNAELMELHSLKEGKNKSN